jgi:hypothetical protein
LSYFGVQVLSPHFSRHITADISTVEQKPLNRYALSVLYRTTVRMTEYLIDFGSWPPRFFEISLVRASPTKPWTLHSATQQQTVLTTAEALASIQPRLLKGRFVSPLRGSRVQRWHESGG